MKRFKPASSDKKIYMLAGQSIGVTVDAADIAKSRK